MAKRTNRHSGSSFQSFLEEEGIYEKVVSTAAAELIAQELLAALHEKDISLEKLTLAMNEPREAVRRLFSGKDEEVTLKTLQNVATLLNKKIDLHLVDA
jgi:antitoxin HicB